MDAELSYGMLKASDTSFSAQYVVNVSDWYDYIHCSKAESSNCFFLLYTHNICIIIVFSLDASLHPHSRSQRSQNKKSIHMSFTEYTSL